MTLPSLLFPKTLWAFIGVFAAFLNALLRVAIVPVFVRPIFDQVLAQNNLSDLSSILLLTATVVIAGSLALFIQDAALARLAAKTSAVWRKKLYQTLLQADRLPGTSGGLGSRILTDLKDVELYCQYGLGSLIAETLTLLGIFAVLLYYNTFATFLLILLAVPLLGVLSLLGRQLERAARRSQEATEELGAHLQEGFKHQQLIRSFFAGEFMLRRFANANQRTQKSMTQRGLWAALQTPISQLVVFAAVAVLVVVLARSVIAGSMTPGELLSYLTLVALMSTPVQLLLKSYTLLRQARAASIRLRALLPLEKEKPVFKAVATAKEGLELKGLSFAYKGSRPILDRVNLQLPAQGLIAITGESGNGKTSLLLLLLRLLKPSEGEIFLNGQALSLLPEAGLRARIAYVPQGSDLLRGSIRDNVCLGREADDARLWDVLKAVSLKKTIDHLPSRLDYELQEDGKGLSGGQKQRLSVARALLSDPECLLLDEPSANLDKASEEVLATSLKQEAKKRLVLVVAHRPRLIESADEVIHLKEGKLYVQAASGKAS